MFHYKTQLFAIYILAAITTPFSLFRHRLFRVFFYHMLHLKCLCNVCEGHANPLRCRCFEYLISVIFDKYPAAMWNSDWALSEAIITSQFYVLKQTPHPTDAKFSAALRGSNSTRSARFEQVTNIMERSFRKHVKGLFSDGFLFKCSARVTVTSSSGSARVLEAARKIGSDGGVKRLQSPMGRNSHV